MKMSKLISVWGIVVISTLNIGCIDWNNESNQDTIEDNNDVTMEIHEDGYVNEGEFSRAAMINIEENQRLISMFVEVKWMDEPDIERVRTFQNSPDEFQIWLEDDGWLETRSGNNEIGGEGLVYVEFPLEYFSSSERIGPLNITVDVEIMYSGDFHAFPWIGGVNTIEDVGNSYSCYINYTYANGVSNT